MPEETLRLALIVGSTREGRIGDTIARWFAGVARGTAARTMLDHLTWWGRALRVARRADLHDVTLQESARDSRT